MDQLVQPDATAIQARILEHVRQMLKCETVNPEDYYLDLGGDSLLAPILARRIEAEFGFRPELEDVFSRCFADLAALVAHARETK